MTTNTNDQSIKLRDEHGFFTEHGFEQHLAAYIETNDYPPCECWVPGHDETHGGSMSNNTIDEHTIRVNLGDLRPSTLNELHQDTCPHASEDTGWPVTHVKFCSCKMSNMYRSICGTE